MAVKPPSDFSLCVPIFSGKSVRKFVPGGVLSCLLHGITNVFYKCVITCKMERQPRFETERNRQQAAAGARRVCPISLPY